MSVVAGGQAAAHSHSHVRFAWDNKLLPPFLLEEKASGPPSSIVRLVVADGTANVSLSLTEDFQRLVVPCSHAAGTEVQSLQLQGKERVACVHIMPDFLHPQF
jgi:hypothetical protein